MAADGEPCPVEGQKCGGGCIDPCQFCNFLDCTGGTWHWMEAFPDPNCGDTGPDVPDTPDCGPGLKVSCPCSCGDGTTLTVHDSYAPCEPAPSCYADNFCCGQCESLCKEHAATCDSIKAAYAKLVGPESRTCTADADCHVLFGQCSVGLGGCWEVVNGSVQTEDLAALGKQYAQSGCTQGVCDCPGSPEMAVCKGGSCASCNQNKLLLTQANPEKYEFYELCIPKDYDLDGGSPQEAVKAIDPSLYCGVAGNFAKCDPQTEEGCHGDLAFVPDSKKIADAKMLQLCSLSNLSFVSRIAGGHFL
jgi:hypothetical protein